MAAIADLVVLDLLEYGLTLVQSRAVRRREYGELPSRDTYLPWALAALLVSVLALSRATTRVRSDPGRRRVDLPNNDDLISVDADHHQVAYAARWDPKGNFVQARMIGGTNTVWVAGLAVADGVVSIWDRSRAAELRHTR